MLVNAWKVWCIATSVGLLSSGAAYGQGESKKNCGPGRRPGINGCVDAAPRARGVPQQTKVSDAKASAAAPAPEQGMRLPRGGRTSTEEAERMLLQQELAQLEQLLKTTPKNAPERAAIIKRLADTYADLARRAEYDGDVARIRAERAEQERKAASKSSQRPRRPIRM